MDGYTLSDALRNHERATQAGSAREPWRDHADFLATRAQERQDGAAALDAAIEAEDTGRDNPPSQDARPDPAQSSDSAQPALAGAVAGASTRPAKANALAAADFLAEWVQGWGEDWYLNLVAIPAAGASRSGTDGASWPAGEVAARREEIAAWIEARSRERMGVYFTPNPVRSALTKKPTKHDLAAIVSLPVDLDPPDDGRPYEERRAVIEQAAQAIMAGADDRPTLAVDSGNGLRATRVSRRCAGSSTRRPCRSWTMPAVGWPRCSSRTRRPRGGAPS